MIAAGAFGIVVFFLFVTPGICYELMRDRARLPREESTFVHVSRVLLSGTFITAISVFLMALVRWISPDSLLNLPDLLTQSTVYVADHAVLVGWTLLVQLGLSASLAVVLSDVITSRAAKGKPIHQADTWHAMCEKEAEPYEYVKVSVHLKSGRDILGVYVGASTELDPAKRELILGAPLEDRMAGSDQAVSLDDSWQRMVIPGSEIEYLVTSYVGTSKPANTTRSPGLPRRVGVWVQEHWRSWKVAGPFGLALLSSACCYERRSAEDNGSTPMTAFASPTAHVAPASRSSSTPVLPVAIPITRTPAASPAATSFGVSPISTVASLPNSASVRSPARCRVIVTHRSF